MTSRLHRCQDAVDTGVHAPCRATPGDDDRPAPAPPSRGRWVVRTTGSAVLALALLAAAGCGGASQDPTAALVETGGVAGSAAEPSASAAEPSAPGEAAAAKAERVEAERVEAERVAAEAAAAEAARVVVERVEAERVAAEQAAAAEVARVAAQQAAVAEAARVAADQSSSVSYANCDAVRAAGADPIYAGEPGYAPKLDRDGDGIACDT